MKILTTFVMVASVAVVAGCAHNEREASYDETISTYPTYSSTTTPSSSAGRSARAASSQTGSSQYSSGAYSSANTSTQNQLGSAEDSALVSQVRQSLSQDAAIAAVIPNLQISARNGIVTIGGNVSSDEQRKNIESIVQQISGVTMVENRLQVSSSLSATSRTNETSSVYSGTAGSGSEMQRSGGSLSQTSRASEQTSVYSGGTNAYEKASTGTNEWFTPTSRANEENRIYSNTNQLEGATNDQLSATSRRSDQSATLYQTNQVTSGNSGVGADTPTMSAADRTLTQEIMRELQGDTSLASALSEVKILANEGKVTVQGTVSNEQQKHDIESAVQRITGVSSVDNQLQVGADQSMPY